MSKKNRPQKQPKQPQPKSAVSPNSNKQTGDLKELTLGEKIIKATNAIFTGAESEDLDKVENLPMASDTTMEDISKMFNDLEQSRQFLVHQQKRADELKNDYAQKQLKLTEDQRKHIEAEKALDEREREYEERRNELDSRLEELDTNQKVLHDLSADLDRREMDAKIGFQSLYQDALEKQNQELNRFSEELRRLNQEFAEKRIYELTAWQLKLDEIKQATEQVNTEKSRELDTRSQQVEDALNDIVQQRIALRREQNAIDAKQQILDEDREALNNTLEQKTKALVDKFNFEKETLNAVYKQAAKERDGLRDKFLAWEKVRTLVGKEPDAILETLERLTKESDRLSRELRNRPSEINIQKVEDLEQQQANWELERWSLVQQASEMNNKLNRMRVQAIEVETQRDLILALELKGKVLDAQLAELQMEVERKIGQEEGKSPFPQCCAFDQDSELQSKLETHDPEDLDKLTNEIQARIASDGLYYEMRDIRNFLAGLSMSQTIILQGISGTGKTSLPLKFAEAIGGGREVIEVQAGWRDRDDLLGHYNSFEQKFYESKFLQALYQAQCPSYAKRIFIILLDEMNLSYPEQYFADFLSALQMDPNSKDRKIDLISAALPSRNYPQGFINKNRSLRIPENVWFVGTANKDETTKDIADKTYDRSHIMELPIQHPKLDVPRITNAPQNISRDGLNAAFIKARKNKTFQSDALRTWDFLNEIRMDFSSQFALGWGNRLKRQIDDFVPVVRACDGTWAEATDNILSMKVLRKLRDRYEIQSQDLKNLERIIATAWKKSGKKEPVEEGLARSIQIIKDEQRKKTDYSNNGTE